MRLGINIPHMGPEAGPEAITRVATAAEAAGYETLWATDRLLAPANPRTPYAGTADGSLPDVYRRVIDPLDALTFAAAATTKIGLGTSVLNMPFYNPVTLGRRLTSIDVLSAGRLRVGFGQGWSIDEFEAVGIESKSRGRRADELIQVLHAMWKDNPAEFKGRYYTLPKSIIDLRPVQKPHPPIYFAAFAPASMRRIATYGDGWLPVAIPVDGMKQMWQGILGMAKEAGRDTSKLEFVVRANTMVTDAPLGEGRFIFTGSKDEIRGDIAACRDIGAAEVAFDPSFEDEAQTVDGFLGRLEMLRELDA
jgi:probable F420-dependent oxidoreductase